MDTIIESCAHTLRKEEKFLFDLRVRKRDVREKGRKRKRKRRTFGFKLRQSFLTRQQSSILMYCYFSGAPYERKGSC